MAGSTNSSEAVLAGWRECYGVDLQGERCVAVRAARARGRVVCSPVDGGAIERIAGEGLPMVGVMSERESFTRWVEAPYRSVSKARKVFPTLLDIQLPFALDDCVYTFIDVIRSAQGQCRGLAAAARRTHVSAQLTACEARGVDPMVLDQAGLALWTQALREFPVGEAAAPRIVAALDETRATLVKGVGTGFVSAHTVRIDDADRIRHLAAGTDESADVPPTEWVFCGAAATPDRVDTFWKALDATGSCRTVDDPTTFLARAIATRALLAGSYRCNLRCGDMMHDDLRSGNRRRGRRTVAFALGAALVLAAADGVALWRLKTQTAAVDRAVSSEIDALAGYHVTARGRDALRAVQDEVQDRKEALAAFSAAMEPSLIADLVRLMEGARANGLTFDAVQLSPERVEITGTSPDWKRCEALLPMLPASGGRPELKRGEALASERIPFTVTQGGQP